jgi:Na+-transporting NADH:ubiquinone oxidoreductase subunit B/electron transport complex protein RnfD
MKAVRSLLDKLYEAPALSRVRPIIGAADAILYGTNETTHAAPHVVDNIDIKRYMSLVIAALIPATLAAIALFGPRVIAMIMVSYAAGGLVEVLFAIVRKHDIHEGFLITGLIFPLVLPPTTPLWIVAVGVVFGTLFGKEVFGGTGRNPFNPALVGRLFITIAFPAIMTMEWKVPLQDAVTSATPLSQYKSEHVVASAGDLLMGQSPGSMGEVCRIAIIAGGVFLMLVRVSNWRIPVSYLATVFVFALIGNRFISDRIAPPVFQLLAGGLLFGAMFMATDPITSPFTKAGKYVFGISCGVLTVLIRSFSGYVEGVMFSIVLMNAFSPLIDQIVLMFKYRAVKP